MVFMLRNLLEKSTQAMRKEVEQPLKKRKKLCDDDLDPELKKRMENLLIKSNEVMKQEIDSLKKVVSCVNTVRQCTVKPRLKRPYHQKILRSNSLKAME